MKRPLLIIIGVIMVVLLIAVWVYVLFFSKPNASEETFTDLNFGNTTDTTYQPSDTNKPTNTPLVDVQGKEKLRQLTTRPVVGYQDIQLSTSSMPFTYYVEAGTGHLFSINLQTGEEKRLSGTTIPVSRLAAITPNGAFVMIQSGSGAGSKFVVGEISSSSESLALEAIDESVVDFKESTTNTFLYSVQTANSLIAKEYDPVKKASKTLFTIPFREAHIDWGSSATATHYFYPKATAQLEGYGYQVVKGTIERLPVEYAPPHHPHPHHPPQSSRCSIRC
jgi:hypothetical protein